MALLRYFLRGWVAAAALWRVVVLLYLVDAALALVLALPTATQLGGIFGRSTMAPDLAGPLTLNLLAEVWAGTEEATPPWPLFLLVPAVALVVGTFLRGGTLGALARGSGPFRWTEFFSDCARFFPRLLVLLLFFVPGLLAVGLLFIAAHLALGLLPISDPMALAARTAVLAFLLFLLLTAMDYARLGLVLAPERSLPRHVGGALWFVGRRLPRVVALGLAFALAAALLAATYPALLQLPGFSGRHFLRPLAAQAVILLASWQRLAALGGELALFRGEQEAPSAANPGNPSPLGRGSG